MLCIMMQQLHQSDFSRGTVHSLKTRKLLYSRFTYSTSLSPLPLSWHSEMCHWIFIKCWACLHGPTGRRPKGTFRDICSRNGIFDYVTYWLLWMHAARWFNPIEHSHHLSDTCKAKKKQKNTEIRTFLVHDFGLHYNAQLSKLLCIDPL